MIVIGFVVLVLNFGTLLECEWINIYIYMYMYLCFLS